MSKSLLVLLVALLFCGHALHMQKYGPSQPGGNYYTPPAPNGTSTSYPSYPSTNYGSTTGTIGGVYINGVPYNYTGPFTLVCYYQNSTQVFRYDSCYDATTCAKILNDYRQCAGTVQRYRL